MKAVLAMVWRTSPIWRTVELEAERQSLVEGAQRLAGADLGREAVEGEEERLRRVVAGEHRLVQREGAARRADAAGPSGAQLRLDVALEPRGGLARRVQDGQAFGREESGRVTARGGEARERRDAAEQRARPRRGAVGLGEPVEAQQRELGRRAAPGLDQAPLGQRGEALPGEQAGRGVAAGLGVGRAEAAEGDADGVLGPEPDGADAGGEPAVRARHQGRTGAAARCGAGDHALDERPVGGSDQVGDRAAQQRLRLPARERPDGAGGEADAAGRVGLDQQVGDGEREGGVPLALGR